MVKEKKAKEIKEDSVKEAGSKTVASVYDRSGVFVRNYSLEAQGEDFEKLASGYAGKIGGSVR